MSSFVVDNETLCICVKGLITYFHRPEDEDAEDDQEFNVFSDYPRSFLTQGNEQWWGQELLKLNLKAYVQRYGELENDLFNRIFEWKDPGKITPAQYLKSLKCLRYQCSEGSATKDLLYLFLSAGIDVVLKACACYYHLKKGKDIQTQMEYVTEYEQAIW